MLQIQRVQVDGQIAISTPNSLKRSLKRKPPDLFEIPDPPLDVLGNLVADFDHPTHCQRHRGLRWRQPAEFRQRDVQRMPHHFVEVPKRHVAVERYRGNIHGRIHIRRSAFVGANLVFVRRHGSRQAAQAHAIRQRESWKCSGEECSRHPTTIGRHLLSRQRRKEFPRALTPSATSRLHPSTRRRRHPQMPDAGRSRPPGGA